jgi:predicted SPOUT superfamily RNA methylase MTH1
LDDEKILPPKTRVTLKLHETSTGLSTIYLSILTPECSDAKNLRGQLISPSSIRQNEGIYWGYTVRIAKSLSDIVSKPYDIVIGTSERGIPVQDLEIPKDGQK